MAPHNNKGTNKTTKQKFGKSLQKKPSGLQKNQSTKKEERVTVDQVINESVANQGEAEDEEEVKKRKEEERQKWLEEQRIKYPIAPDGYIPNSVIKSRLGKYNPRAKNESHASASDQLQPFFEADKEFHNGSDFDEHWHLPFADPFISIESVDQRGSPIIARKISSKSKYRKEKNSFSEVDTLIRETPLVDDPLENVKANYLPDDEMLPSVESDGFFNQKNLQMSNSERTPHQIGGLNNDGTPLERNNYLSEGDNAVTESSAKEHVDDHTAFYVGDDEEDVLDHYSYRRHDHKDNSDKLLKISSDLQEVPEEEDEAYDDFLETGQLETEFEYSVEEDASIREKTKPDNGSTDTPDQTKTSKMSKQTPELKKIKLNPTIRRKKQSSTTPEVNFNIKLCQQNDSDQRAESPVVVRSNNNCKKMNWDSLKQASNDDDESILFVRKIKTRTEFENERKAEMFDVVNDNKNILEQIKPEFKTKTITYVGIVKRNKFSGDDDVQTYSAMKFISQGFDQSNDVSVTKPTETGSQRRHGNGMLLKKEDSSGHVNGRNWKNVRNARSVSADGIETTSKLPSIKGINRIRSAGIEMVQQRWSASKPNSGSSLMSSTLTNQTSGNSNKFNTFSPTTNGEDSFTNNDTTPLPKITNSSKFGNNRRPSSPRRHRCLYSRLVRMHLHDHISIAKHLRTMELHADASDCTVPVGCLRYGRVVS